MSSSSDAEDPIRDHVNCPICTDISILPRSYPCGHSFCTPCHVAFDEDDRKETDHLSEYKCPICRQLTWRRWHERPINVSLKQIASTYPEYEARLKTYRPPSKDKIEVPETFNLTEIAKAKRRLLSEEVLNFLLPHLLRAAMDGHTRFVVSNADAKRKIDKVLDLVTKRLFEHGQLHVISTSTTLEFDFDRTVNVRRLYTNIEPPAVPGDDDDASSADPPGIESTSSILRNLQRLRRARRGEV